MPRLQAIRPAPELPGGGRAALVIATSSYEDTSLSQLRAPGNDAAEFADTLGDPAIGGFAVTQAIDKAEPQVRRAVGAFLADRKPEDLVLIYLSCHGVLDRRGRLYFAATDTLKTQLGATAIEAVWLLDQLIDCRARRQVLILDCCFSGAFASGAKGEVDLEERLIGQSRGRAVLTASRAWEYSFEGVPVPGSSVTRSLFTTALIDGLRTGAADFDRDGYITLDEVYDHAYEYVLNQGHEQTPQRWLYGGEGKIVIARNPAGVVVTPASLPEALLNSLDSPYPNVRAAAVSTLSEWLRDDDLARVLAAQEALEKIAGNDVPAVASLAREHLTTARPVALPVREVPIVLSPPTTSLPSGPELLRELYDKANSALPENRYGGLESRSDVAIYLLDVLLAHDAGYPGAAELRANLQRKQQLAFKYAMAVAVERVGDWETAIRLYAEITAVDPSYRDTRGRADGAERKQRILSLQAAIARAADAEEWQAVLEADQELHRVDTSWSDPRGFAARARDAQGAADRAVHAQAGDRWLTTVQGTDSPDAPRLATRSLGTLAAYCRKPLHHIDVRFEQGYTGLSPVICWHPRLRRIAAVPKGRKARVYDVSGSDHWEDSAFKVVGFLQSASGMTFSPEGAHLAILTGSGHPRICDVGTGKQLPDFRLDQTGFSAIALTTDGTRLVTAGTSPTAHTAYTWDAATGSLLLKISHSAGQVALSQDGSRLAALVGNDLDIWDMSTGQRVLHNPIHAIGSLLSISPDGTRIAAIAAATARNARAWKIWDAITGEEVVTLERNKSEASTARTPAFSPDNTRLATSSHSEVRVWDTATGQLLYTISAGGYDVAAMAFSPDGTLLATVSIYAIQIWPVAEPGEPDQPDRLGDQREHEQEPPPVAEPTAAP